ncbi:MAG TPA: glutathione S-transferase N-terminal domain-containing protein [Patescibacteria group bacterium]|nr:glutathione S-transferase N-terminal domain-containing protein [Patescibacteria group bacterium]
MIQIFTKQGCPYCAKVLEKAEELGIEIENIDAPPGSENRKKLVELGGKEQVPFLYIPERELRMYESDDIVVYLEEHFGKKS